MCSIYEAMLGFGVHIRASRTILVKGDGGSHHVINFYNRLKKKAGIFEGKERVARAAMALVLRRN